jgi:hypothetical protein
MTKFKRRETTPDAPKTWKQASAIFAGDIHIRATIPECRTDNFLFAQEKKWKWVIGLAKKHECPIIIAGDLGENAQWPNWLLEWFITVSRRVRIIVVPGQHDLPNHRLDLWKKSAIGVLHAGEAIEVCLEPIIIKDTFGLFPFPFDMPLKNHTSKGSPNVAVAHMMVIEDKPLWPGQEAPRGHALLKEFNSFDTIVTGDNHNRFVHQDMDDGRLLINCGSFTRHKADQIDHEPHVYLYYAESNHIKEMPIPIEPDVVSRIHIDRKEHRDQRVEAFITHLHDDYEIGLDFEQNLEDFFRRNRTRKEIKQKVWEFVG